MNKKEKLHSIKPIVQKKLVRKDTGFNFKKLYNTFFAEEKEPQINIEKVKNEVISNSPKLKAIYKVPKVRKDYVGARLNSPLTFVLFLIYT